MKGRSRKQKGKKFEDKIAKLIYERYLKYIPEYRNFLSTIDNKKVKQIFLPNRDFASGSSNRLKGDIDLSIGFKYFPFLIECKKWKKLDYKLHRLLSLRDENEFLKIELGKIFYDTKLKAEEFGLKPMVVFEYDYGVPLCLCRVGDIKEEVKTNIKTKLELLNNYLILDFVMVLDAFKKLLSNMDINMYEKSNNSSSRDNNNK